MMNSNKEHLQEIENQLKHEKSRRMFERYLYLMGTSYQQIAKILGRSERTIGTYIRSYKNHGLEGITMNFSSGKPPRLTGEQQEQLKQTIINHVPYEIGFAGKFNWTLEIIGMYIEREFGFSYSIRGISKMMHRLGLSYTKPTYTLVAADEKKQKEFVESTFPELKKLRKRRN
jgi:transposase